MMTDFRLWSKLSELKPAQPADDDDTPASRAKALLAASRKVKGQPPELPPEGTPARAILDAVKKARGK